MKRPLIVLVGIACLAAAGCAQRTETRVADFTLVATRLVQFQNIDRATKTHLTRGVVGEYMVSRWREELLRDGIKSAVDDAIHKASGDMMVNCVLYYVEDPPNSKIGYKVVGDVIQTMGVPDER